ncbi:MAG: mechanosensitive ion channel domain-containing protein [Luteimonas sp.]
MTATRPRIALHHLVLSACLWLLPGLAAHAAPPAQATTSPVAITTPDLAGETPLHEQLAADAALKHVTAVVQGGVAQLDGTVLEPAQREQAATIAAQTPGVTRVVNRINVDGRLITRFAIAYDQMTGKLIGIVTKAPLLLIAALLVMFSTWLGGVLSRHLRLFRMRSENPYMDGLIRRLVQVVVILIGVLLALNLIGLTSLVGAVLGSAGVVGLALGFAFKDIAENYIAGILLSVRNPFSPGDHVKVDSYEGKVVALTSRDTILITLDGNQLRLPNALVFKSVLLNYSQNPNRRFDFGFTIDGAQSIRHAQTLAVTAYSTIEGVLADPPPSWTVVESTPSGIDLRFYGWIDQRASDLGKVRSESIRLVKAAFAHAGVESPRTIHHIVTSRDRNLADDVPVPVEPAHATGLDISVNRDIDKQLADAQRADGATNMLEPGDNAS